MNTDEFYVSVPIEGDEIITSDTHLIRFNYNFPKELHLDETWRVALVELLHPGWKGCIAIDSSMIKGSSGYRAPTSIGLAHIQIVAKTEFKQILNSHVIIKPLYRRLDGNHFITVSFELDLREAEGVSASSSTSGPALILHFKRMDTEGINEPLILRSDANMDLFPMNAPISFTNVLDPGKYFEKGMFEIALTEIAFVTKTWRHGNIITNWAKEDREPFPDFDLSFKYRIDWTMEEFRDSVDAILNENLKEKDKNIKTIPKIRIVDDILEIYKEGVWGDKTFTLDFDDKTKDWLMRVGMGIRDKKQNELVSVTCSVVEPSIIGSHQDRSLRLIPLTIERDHSFSMRFSTPYYVPLSDAYVSRFDIELRTQGAKLDLGPGVLYIYLDIRLRYQ